MTTLVKARAVGVKAGEKRLVDGASLVVRAGEVMALLGPSGAGKSTLLKALCGLISSQGTIELLGQSLEQQETLGPKLGYVPQDDIIPSALTVEQAVRYASLLRRPHIDQRDGLVAYILRQVDLQGQAKLRIRRLSGGQRKRVSLAVELVADPPLLLMDEPTSGLDPALEAQMMSLFRRLTTPKRATILTTHMTASLDMVDLVVMLVRGRIVFIGPSSELSTFFGAPGLLEVYRVVSEANPIQMQNRFHESSLFREFVVDRMAL